jgi:hypothetical protein
LSASRFAVVDTDDNVALFVARHRAHLSLRIGIGISNRSRGKPDARTFQAIDISAVVE